MMIATTAGGAFMYAVHKVAKQIPDGEYSLFLALLQVITLLGVPGIGLQTVFAQQAAAAFQDYHVRELAGVFRGALRAIFFIWLAVAAGVVVFHHAIMTALKMTNPAALVITVVIGLIAMAFPMVNGMLQGRQNFLWLGWTSIINGVGRFLCMCVIVLFLGGKAAGAMVAVFLGMLTVVIIGIWQNLDIWKVEPAPVDWRRWLARLVPLTVGLGASIFMLSADMIFAKIFFDKKQTDYYGAAGMIGRALVFFTQPLAAVMFPKIVQSAARAEKTNVLAQALGVTALAGGAAALGCTLFPTLPLRVVYDKDFLTVAGPLVPWFAWCMLPLTLSTILINALLGRAQYKAVPWLALVAVAYGLTLYFRHESFEQVIQTLGCFSTLMLAVCAWFTWGPGNTSNSPATGTLASNGPAARRD
jgi:O-antigen/teichoic acid export membrane protein